jgi:hypothetical protein
MMLGSDCSMCCPCKIYLVASAIELTVASGDAWFLTSLPVRTLGSTQNPCLPAGANVNGVMSRFAFFPGSQYSGTFSLQKVQDTTTTKRWRYEFNDANCGGVSQPSYYELTLTYNPIGGAVAADFVANMRILFRERLGQSALQPSFSCMATQQDCDYAQVSVAGWRFRTLGSCVPSSISGTPSSDIIKNASYLIPVESDQRRETNVNTTNITPFRYVSSLITTQSSGTQVDTSFGFQAAPLSASFVYYR